MERETMKKPFQSVRDPPPQPPSDPSARAWAELIENLAVLVVRQHRRCRRRPPSDQAGSPASPTPSTS
jgi:hypothetical protein